MQTVGKRPVFWILILWILFQYHAEATKMTRDRDKLTARRVKVVVIE